MNKSHLQHLKEHFGGHLKKNNNKQTNKQKTKQNKNKQKTKNKKTKTKKPFPVIRSLETILVIPDAQ